MLFFRQKNCRIQTGIRTRVFIWVLNFHDLLSCTNKWKINEVKEKFLKGKLAFIRKDIWRGQDLCPGTRIFSQFLHFHDLQLFTYLWKKIQVWSSWSENLIILVRMFEEVRLVLELEFLVSFCILMIYKYLPSYDENFESGVHEVKIGLFLSQNICRGLVTRIFGEFLNFDNLQPFTY